MSLDSNEMQVVDKQNKEYVCSNQQRLTLFLVREEMQWNNEQKPQTSYLQLRSHAETFKSAHIS